MWLLHLKLIFFKEGLSIFVHRGSRSIYIEREPTPPNEQDATQDLAIHSKTWMAQQQNRHTWSVCPI